ETDDKGGVLKLIERETGRTGEARFDWLREQGFKPNGDKPSKLGAIVATFDYHAPDGELRFQVVKYDPKNFRQRRPDGKGGWIWDLDGVQKIPYRLPELIEDVAQARTIVIVEGEKDVDALRAIGVPATCNPGGAGKWRTEFNEHLRGADVVVVADNDPPGQDHMREVAAKLANTAKRIRLIDLGKAWPECPLKGDTYDFLQSHTREQFDALIDAAPDYEPSADKQNGTENADKQNGMASGDA